MRTRRSMIHMPEAQINITSLLDITFVLLISFMVVAPALRYDVGLKLPKTSGSGAASKDRPVAVQIKNGDGGVEYFVNGRPVDLGQLVSSIKDSKEFEKDQTISLEADRTAPWQDVAEVMALLKENEITSVSIITEVRGT